MAKCETCGNEYEKVIEVAVEGQVYTFDSFECAIHKLAPTCAHCGCKILGHGVEANEVIYCCAHCARQSGVSGLVDNA